MSRVTDMTVGRPAPLLLGFAAPLILTNLGQQLYMIVDAAIVGRGVGVAALAAVGATDWSYWLVLWAVLGLTQGFSTFISRYFGEGDLRKMNETVAAAATLTAVVGAVFSLLAVLLARPLLLLLDTPEDILAGAVTYFTTMAAGILIVAAYNMAAAVLRALGDGRSPLLAMGIAALLNVGLDLLFVLAFGWGLFGAALASVLSQLVSFLFCLVRIRGLGCVRIAPRDLLPSRARVLQLLGFGLPLAMQNTVISLGGMILQSTINREGSIVIAGFTATNKLYGLLESTALSLGAAAATFLAQNYGARRYGRVREGVRCGFLLSVGAALLVGAIVFPLRHPLLRLFLDTESPEGAAALAVGERYLTVMLLSLVSLYLIHLYRNALQSVGVARFSMLSGLAEFFVRAVIAKLVILATGPDILYYVEPIAWLAALLFVIPPYYAIRRRRLLPQGDG